LRYVGLDPLYIANEGKLIVIVPSEDAELALETLRSHPYGHKAVEIDWWNQAPKGSSC
jgi:hydrogenase expression/formation protein HypE